MGTQAVLTEVQRVACVAPLSLVHVTTQDHRYGSHVIPKGAAVLANLSFIMKNPAHFPEPHLFNPYRFLNQAGEFVKSEHFIPFGVGKRVCMGEPLARNELFIFLANLVQRLEFLPPLSHPLPNREDYYANFTHVPSDF